VSVLPHVDLGAIALEAHLIHELIDQEDATTVVGVDVLAYERVRNFFRLEAIAGIANDDQHAAFLIAGNATLDAFGGIVFAAMQNGVGKGLAQGGFDLKFLACSTIHAAGHLHDALYHRTYAARIGVERNLNPYHQVGATRRVRHNSAGRRFLPTEYRQRYCDIIDSGGQAGIIKMAGFWH
jgi:hypothetical protein